MVWKRWEIALAAALTAAVLLCAFPIHAQQELAGKLTRLHVLANSDDPEDQRIKLKVRDAVLEASQGESRLDEALLEKLRLAAQETVYGEGRTERVTVTRENCYFDTRVYENFSLPAGYYDAVRVVIGEGAGHNWWCVIYPPLCAGLCEDDWETVAREAGLTQDEIGLICEEKGYVLRFQLADWWGKLVHFFSER